MRRFILLSTSRVYAIAPLAACRSRNTKALFGRAPAAAKRSFRRVSAAGVDETFPRLAPISLYGATKLASEALALEYGATFSLPVFINRCGVLAGAGQFGRADQGIFAYWINAWLRQRPLKYIGFGGNGYQVRDCLHPRDLLPALAQHSPHREAARTESRISPARGIIDVAEAALRLVARRTSARTRSASIRRRGCSTFRGSCSIRAKPRGCGIGGRRRRRPRFSSRSPRMRARIRSGSTCRRRCEPLDPASNFRMSAAAPPTLFSSSSPPAMKRSRCADAQTS